MYVRKYIFSTVKEQQRLEKIFNQQLCQALVSSYLKDELKALFTVKLSDSEQYVRNYPKDYNILIISDSFYADQDAIVIILEIQSKEESAENQDVFNFFTSPANEVEEEITIDMR
jgi:hypothetical protein